MGNVTMRVEDVLPNRLAEIEREEPDAILVIEADTERQVTRAEFATLARRWSSALTNLNVVRGDTVVTMVPTGIDAAAAWIGTAWIGAIEAPVNTDYIGEMLAYVVNDSLARTMVIHESYVEAFAHVADRCPRLEHVIVVGPADRPEDLPQQVHSAEDLLDGADPTGGNALIHPGPHDTAAIIYTSGTTGPSKGVIVPWGQLYTSVIWTPPTHDLPAGGVGYAPFPFYHMSPRAFLYRMVLASGRIVFRGRMSVSGYWPDIQRHGCTYIQLLGSMARMLMENPPSPSDLDNPVRYATMLPLLPDVDDFEKRFGIEVGTLFTMTETSGPIVTAGKRSGDPALCGRRRPGCEVRLVDEFDREVPIGEIGELMVRVDEPWTLNGGYWNKPEATVHAWRNGWFHTGDAFRVDEDGNYYFLDRYKDAIRRRGENISSMEVEALVTRHPSVAEAAAIGVPSEVEEEDVMVLVVRSAGAQLTVQELHKYLCGAMPRYMVPRYLEFVDELPRTPTLKVRKVDLRARGVTSSTMDMTKETAHGK